MASVYNFFFILFPFAFFSRGYLERLSVLQKTYSLNQRLRILLTDVWNVKRYILKYIKQLIFDIHIFSFAIVPYDLKVVWSTFNFSNWKYFWDYTTFKTKVFLQFPTIVSSYFLMVVLSCFFLRSNATLLLNYFYSHLIVFLVTLNQCTNKELQLSSPKFFIRWTKFDEKL